MISLRDCLDFSELSDETIAVIVEHEHVPAIVAAEIGRMLMTNREGMARMESIMLDCIDRAARRGQNDRVRTLQRLHADFVRQHAANG